MLGWSREKPDSEFEGCEFVIRGGSLNVGSLVFFHDHGAKHFAPVRLRMLFESSKQIQERRDCRSRRAEVRFSKPLRCVLHEGDEPIIRQQILRLITARVDVSQLLEEYKE